MEINLNNLIGSYYSNAVTGESGIVGASDRMNERYRKKMKENALYEKDVKDVIVPYSHVNSIPITSENYEEIRKPTQPMPKHCYGTGFGYQQAEEINQTLKEYYLGKQFTTKELKEYFKDCCKDMRVVMAQEKRTTGLDPEHNRQIILDTYEQFRMSSSVMANSACQYEGRETAEKTGWREEDNIDWVYYNANYYYQSETLRQIFKEAAAEMAQEWNCGAIDTSERDTDHYLSYSSSFNETWNNASQNGTRISNMSDTSASPPPDFYLFFREIIDGDGRTGIYKTGITGKADISGEMRLDPTKSYCLGDLLKKSSSDNSLLQYLNHFDVYTRYYGTVKMRGK